MNLKHKYRESKLSFEAMIEKVGKLIQSVSGNILGDKQQSMMENRLKKRMRQLNIDEPEQYLSYLEKNRESEIKELIGLLTTHHTFFFREYIHFEHLQKILPEIIKNVKMRKSNKIRIWSSACSKGHEPYSISLFLANILPHIDKGIDFEIIATDIDEQSVRFAQNGVYHSEDIKQIPMQFLGDNFIKGKGEISEFYKIKKQIKEKVEFDVLNLLDEKKLKQLGKFDIIFCRNVLIYFSNEDIVKVIGFFKDNLFTTGYLYTGVSESLAGRVNYAHSVFSSCYRLHEIAHLEMARSENDQQRDKTLKVLCVDDSPTVLKILSKIFTKDHGFEVVGTAANGIEAEKYLEKNKNVDLMTLDIHMPEMDGVTYMSKHGKDLNHPSVIMITSVSRDDSTLAQKALSFGAKDYVEKPTLENISKLSEEIRSKAKFSCKKRSEKQEISSFDQGLYNKEKVSNLQVALSECVLQIYCSYSDLENVKNFLKSEMKNCRTIEINLPEIDRVYYPEFEKLLNRAKDRSLCNEKTYVKRSNYKSLGIFFKSYMMKDKILKIENELNHSIVEEGSNFLSSVKMGTMEVVPYTTFAYSALKFILKGI